MKRTALIVLAFVALTFAAGCKSSPRRHADAPRPVVTHSTDTFEVKSSK